MARLTGLAQVAMALAALLPTPQALLSQGVSRFCQIRSNAENMVTEKIFGSACMEAYALLSSKQMQQAQQTG